MNKTWHLSHEMPANATLEQRLHWHIEHARHCNCRPIPQSMLDEMAKRGIAPPKVAGKPGT